MNRNMRKMFTEQQIANLIKANSTKLYQHTIGLDENVNNLAVVVSNRPTPYTSEDVIRLDGVGEGVVSIFVYDDGNSVRAVCSTLNLTSGYYIGADGNTMNLDNYKFQSDDVQAL